MTVQLYFVVPVGKTYLINLSQDVSIPWLLFRNLSCTYSPWLPRPLTETVKLASLFGIMIMGDIPVTLNQ